tara:strand:+ start:354 stop:1352 length:999 start_codon:yes stop_codon:yes gene_type:complete
MNTKKIFSGVQPTGNLHLGNYLGAIRNWVELQKVYDCIFCVVDLHAITIWQSPEDLRANTREVAAAMIASGVDAKKNIIFNQSKVSAHAELAWVFNCVSRLGWLNRMTQFKEKAGKDKERASVGLYSYPNLMAADILAYKATHVPVGGDQKQHLELCREIAAKFNNDFGINFFPIVEPLIIGPATRVMSLKNGLNKMSKSAPSDGSRISLTDSADVLSKKIRKAKTDNIEIPAEVQYLEGRPEVKNLVGIYAALAGCSVDKVLETFGGGGHAVFKKELEGLLIATLTPIREEMKKLLADTSFIDQTLKDGATKAQDISRPIIEEVHKIVGFL